MKVRKVPRFLAGIDANLLATFANSWSRSADPTVRPEILHTQPCTARRE